MSTAKTIPPVERRFKHPIGVQVHSILWTQWDPIGVREMGDWPDDEYDGYVWPLIGKIMQGEGPDKIADYLDWASNEHMGCPRPRELNLAIARELAALRSEQTD